MENKQGQVGLDTVKAVMLILATVTVIGFTIIVLLGSLSDSGVAKDSSGSYLVQNESINGDVSEVIPRWLTTAEGKADVKCTGVIFVNETGEASSIVADNFTLTNDGCMVNSSAETASTGVNETTWKATYSYTYNLYGDVSDNVSVGAEEFFSNTSAWFALLAVVVIILIIAIVIFAVNRFSGGQTAGL